MAERSERITVRVSEGEEGWIIKKAEDRGVSKSRYMRQVTLGDIPQAEVPFASGQRKLKLSNGVTHADMEDLLWGELPKVRNNLNHIARKVNPTNDFSEPEREQILNEIKSCREVIHQLGRKIMEAIL